MFRIYTSDGRLLCCKPTEFEALDYLRSWPQASFVVEETGRGDRIAGVKERDFDCAFS